MHGYGRQARSGGILTQPRCRWTDWRPRAGHERLPPWLSTPHYSNESPPMADQEAYCVKCKTKREVVNSREETFENGRRALRGQCAVCGTNITKFLSSK